MENSMLLLLLLSRFSHVRLCATPQTAAHQAPPSLGFSRQEHWSGLPFPSPMQESEKESEIAQSCPTLSDPTECSLPGSSIHGNFQARVLECGAIAFSFISKVHVLCLYSTVLWACHHWAKRGGFKLTVSPLLPTWQAKHLSPRLKFHKC